MLCDALTGAGWEAVHWSAVGSASAPDKVILDYAKNKGYAVLTHDLDFGAILSATKAHAPSVIQIRTQDILSTHFMDTLIGTLKQFEAEITSGVLIVVDENQSRARILPVS